MARNDLAVSLVKAGSSSVTKRARSATEAIIANGRAVRHNAPADRLTDAMRVNASGSAAATSVGPSHQHRQFLVELTPRKRLADSGLSDLARRPCDKLIEKQHRSSALRADSLASEHCAVLDACGYAAKGNSYDVEHA